MVVSSQAPTILTGSSFPDLYVVLSACVRMADEEPAGRLENLELGGSALWVECISPMVGASSRGKVKEEVTCGGIANSAPAEIKAKVEHVVKIKATLLYHSLHELLICPARWDRSVEAKTQLCLFALAGASLDGCERAAKHGEAIAAGHRSSGLREKGFEELRWGKADAVGCAGGRLGHLPGVFPLDEDCMGLAICS